MSGNGPKSLSDLMFRPGGAVESLVRQADAAANLVALLRSGIGGALGQSIRAASLQPDGTLVVAAASSAWAARLRFESERMRSLCREQQLNCTRVVVRVAEPEAGAAS
ncbi:MAG: DUF721 domain-containing protein [Gammaproteobacteria bacterium]|nr:DUF721 domain-containing protein [Gammaproteobacteria bacterium]